MSTARGAKLKAQYNRVRTSTALRANDMWTNTIGMEQDPQAGSNAAIEAAIYAPTHGGGNRAQRRELAQQLIQATGYQPSVTDYEGLLTLAKAQGSLGVGTRGACKLCGGMGHLTKQCTNFLTGHNAAGTDVVAGAPGAAGGAQAVGMGLLPDPDQLGLSDLSSSSDSSDSDSGSGSSSDSDRERERRRSKKRKHSSKKKKEEKKEKGRSRERKEKREHKHKKSKSKSKKRKREE